MTCRSANFIVQIEFIETVFGKELYESLFYSEELTGLG